MKQVYQNTDNSTYHEDDVQPLAYVAKMVILGQLLLVPI